MARANYLWLNVSVTIIAVVVVVTILNSIQVLELCSLQSQHMKPQASQ